MTDFDPLAPITPAQADALRLCTTKEQAEAVLGRRICGVPLRKGPKPLRYAPFDLCPRWPSLGSTCPRHPIKGIANPKWTTGKKAKRRKAGGRYPEAEKAQAVVLACLTTQTQAAKALNVSQQRISAWANGVDISEGAVKLVQETKEKIADRIMEVVGLAVGELPGKLSAASVNEIVNVIGLAKVAQLLNDEPTERVAGALTDDERARLRAEIRARVNDSLPPAQ